jgi:type IX secretion system PorP/SprF family membrane protein
MNTMKKSFTFTKAQVLIVALSLLIGRMSAQDFHLSQYDLFPLYYNPAQTGIYPGEKMDYRFSGNYRSQWQKLQGKPYSAFGVGFDMPIDRYGAGILVMDHIAGISNFATTQVLLSGAYRITDEKSKNHFLSAGLQVGFMQKRFSYGDLFFENQYNGIDGFDQGMDHGEYIPDLSILRLDANIGVYYKYIDKNKKFDPSVGFAFYHINTPDESFNGPKSDLPIRWNANVACDIHLDDQFLLTPHMLYMRQKKATEINAGLMLGYRIAMSQYYILGGGSYRHKDGVIFQMGIKQGGSIFRISYDVITSPLKNYGGGRGGFEMAVVYTGKLSSKRR